MAGKKQNIAWADVETTGIHPDQGESLLQVAVRITDENLEFIDGDGFERKVFYPVHQVEAMRARATPYVQNMHDKTGLWKALSTEGIPMEQLELELLEHITKYIPEPKSSRLAGNSLYLDKNFIHANLPSIEEHLHYRAYDISTIAGIWEMKHGSKGMYQKKNTHEAMDDITESVNELRHYLPGLFPNGLADLG